MGYQSVGLHRRPVHMCYRECNGAKFEPKFRPFRENRPADFTGMPHHYDRGFTDFRHRPPIFEGKSDTWEQFLMQFNLLVQSFNWTEHKYRDQLLFALKGDALMYVPNLSITVRDNSKESVQQYSARISNLMCRAYPRMEGTPIFNNLAIEHLLRGLPDQKIAYEILTHKQETFLRQ